MKYHLPKGITIWKGRDKRWHFVMKSKGRHSAKTRSIFTRLPHFQQQSVLYSWANNEPAEIKT